MSKFVMEKGYDCEKCKGPDIPDCDKCDYNIGITNSSGRIAGPCGQQNCWYGCNVCEYNNGNNYRERID